MFILILIYRNFTMLPKFNREVNKAFCGFFDQPKYKQHEKLFLESEEDVMHRNDLSRNNIPVKFVFLVLCFLTSF